MLAAPIESHRPEGQWINLQTATFSKLLQAKHTTGISKMLDNDLKNLNELIEQAALVAGSQKKLADLLEIAHPSLIQMKQGKRPANWRVRGGLRAILGEDPAAAFMAAMAEDLEQSEKED
ncbi:MAG: hypothetical protein KIG95_08120 [Comamonas sp.]|nr:hypothetical protein [Comamonas sp.]